LTFPKIDEAKINGDEKDPVVKSAAMNSLEGRFLVAKFEFGMSLEGACHEIEVTPNLELLVLFGMSLAMCFILNFTTSSYLI
jgi:hypothetical protein